jgi:hypothetical protein
VIIVVIVEANIIQSVEQLVVLNVLSYQLDYFVSSHLQFYAVDFRFSSVNCVESKHIDPPNPDDRDPGIPVHVDPLIPV